MLVWAIFMFCAVRASVGIFPDLLRSLVAFAESRGAYELILEYSASNKAAWTRLGFKTIGMRAAAFTTSVQEALNSRRQKSVP